MSMIATFYSYKGGVGRSMALANIATLLAQRGHRVLIIDWDLEAPGLERYFSYFDQSSIPGGLMHFLRDANEYVQGNAKNPDYQDHVWKIDVGGEIQLDLLPSGRQSDSHYAAILQAFDWRDFFGKGGGEYMENIRNRWRDDYEFVLIDSRTGMSDAGGVCTIQMPDVLIGMFTANAQSMHGVREIVDAAQAGRQKLAYDRMPLTVLPVACRIASESELRETQMWIEKFANVFEGVCSDWLPSWVGMREMFERLKIPQVNWFSFGERLAVVEYNVSDPSGMGYVYDRITDLIASDFDDLEAALGSIAQRPKNYERKAPELRSRVPDNTPNYDYDIFVSYRRGGALSEWAERLIHDLEKWLSSEFPEPLRFYHDSSAIKAGDTLADAMQNAMGRSKLMLAILTPPYFASEFCLREWMFFEEAERTGAGGPLILPIVVRGGDDLPTIAKNRVSFDARAAFGPTHGFEERSSSRDYAHLLDQITSAIAERLREFDAADANMEARPD